MPRVEPVTELQRNIVAITEECRQTGEPIYFTRNGKASLVVMDAEAFDREMSLHAEIRDREIRVQKAIMRGYEDIEAGHVRSLSQARKDARHIRSSKS
jgi:PHD/YefM family antitoxin component YafN of YafNO toxin-antitoxin module